MKDKEEYEYQPHKFVFSKAAGKQYCVYCGLVNTNNDFTKWAVNKGCQNALHPSYKSARKKYTNQFDF
jgi:hypothetical protein